MDDAQFREAVRSREPAAWAELYRLHSRELSRQARLALPSQVDADDAVAEVWLKGYHAAGRYDPSRPPFPWLSQICVRVCLTARRHRHRFIGFPTGLDPVARPEASEGPYQEARDALRRAIAALPRRPREVVSLRYLYFLSTDEICRVLGMRENTVHQNLVRGMTQLRMEHTVPEFNQWMQLVLGEAQL